MAPEAPPRSLIFNQRVRRFFTDTLTDSRPEANSLSLDCAAAAHQSTGQFHQRGSLRRVGTELVLMACLPSFAFYIGFKIWHLASSSKRRQQRFLQQTRNTRSLSHPPTICMKSFDCPAQKLEHFSAGLLVHRTFVLSIVHQFGRKLLEKARRMAWH